jgi:hypothetical protein
MKNLIVTTQTNNSFAFLTLKDYSEKIQVPLIQISSNSENRKFEIFNLFKGYDRILFINENIIIRDDCPDLFNELPIDKVSMVLESKFRNSTNEFQKAILHYENYKNLNWKGEWYNTDVMMIPKTFRYIFKNPHFFGEQNLPDEKYIINLRILEEKIKVNNLHYNFNRMHFMDEKLGLVRHDGYLINYMEAPESMIIPKTLEDINIWKTEKNKNGNYNSFSKRNIVISTSGGMGDQICAEPVIRYMKNKIFKNDNITVVSHWPRLFKDIEGVSVLDFDNYKGQQNATLVLHSNPDDEHTEHRLSHVFFHPTDFAAMSLIKQAIPLEDRTIQLKVDIEDFVDLVDLCDINKLSDMVLVHAGKWWESKTFPVEWWQQLVDKLDEEGFTVGLIGKTIDEKQGYLPIECPKNGVDFRDMTSLGAYIALISQAKVLITNDSSPIHIAGSFDNWIITFATAKASYNILPYRKGTQLYKTMSLEKRLLLDDLNTLWLEHLPNTIADLPKDMDWSNYLPDPSEVVNKIKEIYTN